MANFKMNLFATNLDSVQYRAALKVTSAMQGTSCDNIY